MTEVNKIYKCAICNKGYTSIEERSKCETKCLADRKAAEEKLRKAKLEAEKTKRKDEIVMKYEELNKLVADYLTDYGNLKIDALEDKYSPFINKLFGGFYF